MALLAVLALVLSLQPFACLLHCAHLDVLRQRGAAHAYHLLCGTWDHGGGDEIIAEAPAPSTTASAPILIPAYWPGMLSTWIFALGMFVVATHRLPFSFHRPAAFAAVPATPPPR